MPIQKSALAWIDMLVWEVHVLDFQERALKLAQPAPILYLLGTQQ